jgi:alpha-tubulin suppressor-like RCC1 family protein
MMDGRVTCWGDNKYGQTGSGGPSRTPRPVLRPTATGATFLTNIEKLVGAWTHVCAHTPRGEWLCWGRGAAGEFGDNTYSSRGLATPLASGVTCP